MGNYKRTFEVKVEGQEQSFKVASVSCGFTDEFLANQAKALELTEAKDREAALVKNSFEFIRESLNRAGEEQWTVERLKAELDKGQLDAILTKAMEVSGLTRPNLTTPPTLSA